MTMKSLYCIDGEEVGKDEYDELQTEYKKVRSKYANKVPLLASTHNDFLPSSSVGFVDVSDPETSKDEES